MVISKNGLQSFTEAARNYCVIKRLPALGFFSTVRRLRLYACMYVYMYVRKNSSVVNAVGHRIGYDKVVRPKFGVRLAFTSARNTPSPLHLCDARLGIQCTHLFATAGECSEYRYEKIFSI